MRALIVLVVLLCAATAAEAKLIAVGPSDSYTKIEAAVAGDIVEIAPGTYKFRVMLDKTATAASPITIKAKDPTSRPVWDLAGQAVGSWPGSYTAGDKGRGCWQVKGSHYVISGIVFRNCQDVSSAGLRTVNSGPVTIRDCLFDSNTNGITGSADGFVVEFSEFTKNGKLTATGSPTHNVYIYGGTFSLRYSYLHDPIEGQNLHVRARDAVIEYNWITRPASYPLDVMSCNTLCGGTGTGPITQKMLLRGNLIVQGSPANLSQIVALYNDESSGSYDSTGAVSKMALTMVNNTVIGTPVAAGKTQRLVNMRNDGVATDVILHNNIVHQLAELAAPYAPSTSNWSITGSNNWISTGTKTTGSLTGTLTGSAPGFVNAAAKNYHLTAASACRAKAAAVSGLPVKEYYLDELTKLQYRPRATAKDVGAFEYNNSAAPVGPYGTAPPQADAGVPAKDHGLVTDQGMVTDAPISSDAPSTTGDGSAASDAPATQQDGAASGDGPGGQGDGAPPARGDDGCSCRIGASSRAEAASLALLLALGLLSLVVRRRR